MGSYKYVRLTRLNAYTHIRHFETVGLTIETVYQAVWYTSRYTTGPYGEKIQCPTLSTLSFQQIILSPRRR